ncbi:MAG: phosphotransferase [Phycisphaeraceae bacterium]
MPALPPLSQSIPPTLPSAGSGSLHNLPGQESPFGAALEPVLAGACDGRLSAITWFRTTWQRGGAATGYATFRDDHGIDQPVVVKLPVPPIERFWLLHLTRYSDIVPRVYAQGETLNGYDLAWVVMERLPHGPLGSAWNGAEFDLLTQAAARFHAAAAEVPITGQAPHPERDWKAILDTARRNITRDHDVRNEQRWKNALKTAHKKLRDWMKIWNDRPRDQWCHGDLHLGNAMTRVPAPDGPALLLDFAQVHAGFWVEDAVYFEHLYWARRQKLRGRRLCSMIAHERKALGLHAEPDWPRLASVKRALLAMSTPAMLQADGDPHHVDAALEVLEIELNQAH